MIPEYVPGKEGDMSVKDNKALERRMVDEALNNGNLAVVEEGLTPDFVYHGPSGEVKGIPDYKEFLTRLRTYYPDIHVTIEDIVAEGNMVVTRTTSTFTFTGKNGTVNPTGKKVTMAGSIMDRFRDGKIAETWELYDRLDLYQQLGILPVKPVL
jgi:predicted ester cyclase